MALSGSQMGMGLLFGTAMTTYLSLEVARLRLLFKDNVDLALSHNISKHSEPLAFSFPSLYAFFKDVATFGALLLLAFMCENYPLYAHGKKSWDRDMYYFLAILLFVISLCTIKKGKGSDILNRDQTEEWKGWMQFMFLMYHYYHAEEVYNAIRIMITCYVWMTGFGNFSFFYIKQDFGAVRLLQMLWRLNFLVTFLCLTLNNSYILYYICPLHTFYFFMVYITMRIFSGYNHGKYDVRVKILVLAVVVYLIWDCFNGKIFAGFFGLFLSTKGVIGANSGTLWEWYFRTSLDHWSTVLGMVYALNFPLAMKWLTKVEELPKGNQIFIKAAASVIISIPLMWWIFNKLPSPKPEYNLTNAYYGFIPLLSYIFYRNLTLTMRMYYMGVLHELGKITLETYLMQHHVWLTSNAKTLLVIVPGYSKINMLLGSLLFLFVSKQMFRLTMSLRGMLLPDDYRRCLFGTIGVAGVVLGCWGIGAIMTALKLGVASLVVLILLTSLGVIMIIHRRINILSSNSPLSGMTSDKLKTAALSASILVFFVLILSMPLKSPVANPSYNTPKIEPLSTATCLKLVNEGKWIESSTCGSSSTSIAPALCHYEAWEWAPETKACGFHTFPPAAFSSLLSKKRLVIMGDSEARYLYYSVLSGIGHPQTESAHNTSMPKHSDLSYVKGDIDIRFQWRPYAADVAKELTKWKAGGTEDLKPDILLLTSALWDVLHHHNLEEYKKALDDIGAQLMNVKGLKFWMSPVAIVESRLQTEEKKKYLREEEVSAYRLAVSGGAGLLSKVDGLLDAYSLTAGIGQKAIDGVHYQSVVYDVLAQIFANTVHTKTGAKAGEPVRPTQHRLLLGKKYPDGSMSNPALGAMILAIIVVMLFTMDSYVGITFLCSKIFSSMPLTWDEAYEPLLSKITRPGISVGISLGAVGVAGGADRKYQPVSTSEVEMGDSSNGTVILDTQIR